MAMHPLKKGLIGFLVIDALFIVAAVALYVWLVQPRIHDLEAQRDRMTRMNGAMVARVHAVEGRLAIASGDGAGAQRAAGDLATALDALLKQVPKTETREADELTNLRARAMLVQDEATSDPQAARRDFELLDARLATLYAR